MRPALAALERGDALPPPFDDKARAWGTLLGGGTTVVSAQAVVASEDDEPPEIMPRWTPSLPPR